MDEPSLDLRRILSALAEHQVRYVLIGGIAVVLHGSDRTTFDVDVVYARDPENLAHLAAAIKPLRPKLRTRDGDLPFLWDARTLQAGLNFTLSTDAGWVDLLGDAPGISSFDELWARAGVTELYGISSRVASIEDLLAMKRAAGRRKDQQDIIELEAIRRISGEDTSST